MRVRSEPVMPADIDIWLPAKLLVDKHGDTAPMQTAMRADEMLNLGEMDGKLVWLRIKTATEQLLSQTSSGRVQ